MFRFATPLLLVAACTPAAEKATDVVESPASEQAVVTAGGFPPQTPETILGAVPGPCGSPRAEGFLGKQFTPEMISQLKAATGAIEVVVRDGSNPNLTPLDQRLNVMLSPSGKIVLFDCG
jgi:hypothetical protein